MLSATPTNQFLEITKKGQKNSKIFLIQECPHRQPHTPSLYRTLRRSGFEPATFRSRVNSSTTAPHDHLYLHSILVPHVLYKTEHKLII